MAIDTLKIAKRLREAGFTDPPAEAVVTTVQEAAEGAEFATKRDLHDVRSELKADIAALRSELRETELRLDTKIRETELRLEAKLETIRSELLAMKAGHPEPRLRLYPGCAGCQYRRDNRCRLRRGKAARPLRRDASIRT